MVKRGGKISNYLQSMLTLKRFSMHGVLIFLQTVAYAINDGFKQFQGSSRLKLNGRDCSLQYSFVGSDALDIHGNRPSLHKQHHRGYFQQFVHLWLSTASPSFHGCTQAWWASLLACLSCCLVLICAKSDQFIFTKLLKVQPFSRTFFRWLLFLSLASLFFTSLSFDASVFFQQWMHLKYFIAV